MAPDATPDGPTAALTYSITDNDGQGDDGKVTFQFNPSSIKISQSAKFDNKPPSNKLGREEQLKQDGATTIDMGDLIFDGTHVGSAETLFEWLRPLVSPPGKNEGRRPKVVHFIWGPIDYRVALESVAVAYVRFKEDGTPTRAKVDLKLRTQVALPTGTNPTSGGLVGRQARVLVQGENLQRLSQQTYNTPDAWRAIADINGIDDPLRVPTGALIYLPNADELPVGGRHGH
ncbi:MAG TPA: hypothetical protein VHV76_15045 [Mycobacteriales bacterium]|jgi:nucleoid-associated protein YgaU|nr:hypothetical protein [Mycobacteriales bacterium]